MSEAVNHVWLDVDPGHDDAIAILLAVHSPNIRLLGISTVHGNANSTFTAQNAARCLYAFGAPEYVKVYPGASKPLIRPEKHDPEIHGDDGLGGVEGLPDANSPGSQARFVVDDNGIFVRAMDGMVRNIKEAMVAGHKVTVISCGPCTNIALFISVYPDLLEGIEQFVFMGGGVGLGNRSAVAEYNILCDPEAAQILLNAPVKKVMVPINVTHTAILTSNLHTRLMSTNTTGSGDGLRRTLSSLITFFAETYKSTFGFMDGCPLHDPLTVCFVSRPDLFSHKRYHVDVELNGVHTSGETVVDIWNYRRSDDTWGPSGKNCVVVQSLDVDGFFEVFFDCVAKCDRVSPLNH